MLFIAGKNVRISNFQFKNYSVKTKCMILNLYLDAAAQIFEQKSSTVHRVSHSQYK